MIKQHNIFKFFILALLLAPVPVFASSPITQMDIQTILTNLSKVLNPVMVTLMVFSFVSGIFFIMKALITLKSFTMPITQQTKPGELTGPMVHLIVGAVLIWIPTSTQIISNTLFGGGQASIFAGSTVNLGAMGPASATLMSFAPVAVESQWATMLNTIVLYMEFIGFIAFLRGWFILAHSGQGGQQDGVSKGVIHIIGGILAINFLPLVNVVENTIMGTG